MNNIKFNQTGGFPLSTNILDALQTAYSVFNALGEMAGNFAIISGCTVSGTAVSDGVVYINGEVITFKGGTLSPNVNIQQIIGNRIFEDGASKPVVYERFATFGTSTPANTFAWADFKRVFPTTLIKGYLDDFETRITTLEDAPSPIPLGMIAIWNKPATEPIPTGWAECVDLKGRVPVGWDATDIDFGFIGSTGGEKKHQLTIQEMPSHDHSVEARSGIGGSVGSEPWEGVNVAGNKTGLTGGNLAHNNLQPYRVIRFIEYVG